MEFRKRKRSDIEMESWMLEVAGLAVADAMDRRSSGETMPYRVEIPPPPRGISAKNYLERVQSGVSLTLELRDLTDIACDEYTSGLVNANAATGRTNPSLFTRHYHNQNPVLIFQELRPAEID